VTGVDIPAELAPRREGDPAVLVASSDRIRTDLGWQASHDLPAMVADAWTFGQQMARDATQPGTGAR
jgi:UDP-glucose 4-epimerase